MSFKNSILLDLSLLIFSSVLLIGCGDDSSSTGLSENNDNLSSYSGTNTGKEGAFRSARPVKYSTELGEQYYTYYWSHCTVDNGTYTFGLSDGDMERYVIRNDTLFSNYAYTYNKEGVEEIYYEKNYTDIHTGKNNSILGKWDVSPCRLEEGELSCNTNGELATIEFTQDSLIWFMSPNPDFDYIQHGLPFEFLAETFNNELFFRYESDEDAGDISELGITFSNKTKNSVTIDIQGQIVDYAYNISTTTDYMTMIQNVASNGKKCNFELHFSYITPENCNETHKDALQSDYFDGEDETSFTTSYIRDYINRDEYEKCIQEMFANNPIWDLLK